MTFKEAIILPDYKEYTPSIAHMVAQLNFVRETTLEMIREMTLEELDFKFDQKSNTIGTLLKHIAANERNFQVIFIEDRMFTKKEREFWNGAFYPFQQNTGYEIAVYLNLLSDIRGNTLKALKNYPDEWLLDTAIIPDLKLKENKYYHLFHVMEEEISHRGQIKMVRRRFQQ